MAQKVSVQYVDDLDGSAASGPVGFSLDGKSYAIDLSDANASKLGRSSLPSSPQPAVPAGLLDARAQRPQEAQAGTVTTFKRCGAGYGRTATPSKTAAASPGS
jgi:hypothetical protein